MVSLSKKLMLGFGLLTVMLAFVVSARLIPEIVTVDIASITEAFIKQEAQKNLSNKEKQHSVERFSHQLERALDELAHAHKHMIIFPKEAVLKGSKDYTNQVRNLMHLES